MEEEFFRLQSAQEDYGQNHSADHGEDLKNVIKQAKESAVARALAAHKANLEHQRYKACGL